MSSVTPNNTAKYDCDQLLTPSSRCHAHLASRAKPPTMAEAPSTRFSEMTGRANGPNGDTGLSTAPQPSAARAHCLPAPTGTTAGGLRPALRTQAGRVCVTEHAGDTFQIR